MEEQEIRKLVEEKVRINLKTKFVLVGIGFVAGVAVTALVVNLANNKVEEIVLDPALTESATQ